MNQNIFSKERYLQQLEIRKLNSSQQEGMTKFDFIKHNDYVIINNKIVKAIDYDWG